MAKGHLTKFFPGKLQTMLDKVDELGLSHGTSWVSEGHAFAIHDPEVFMTDIVPKFFDKQTRLRSFHRQLAIWGFTRLETGTGGRGVWFNKHFIRDKPELLNRIKRVAVKNPRRTRSADGTTQKSKLPNYTDYQLPAEIETGHVSDAPPNSAAVPRKPSPVHMPHEKVNPTASGNAVQPPEHTPSSLPHPPPPSEAINPLAKLGRMPPPAAGPPMYASLRSGAPYPLPVRSAVPHVVPELVHSGRHPSFVLTSYRQPAGSIPEVASTGHAPPVVPAGYPGAAVLPDPHDLAELELRRLLAYRSHGYPILPVAPSGSHLGVHAVGDRYLDASMLALIAESRRRAAVGSVAPPVPSVVPAVAAGSIAGSAAELTDDELMDAVASRNLLPGGRAAGLSNEELLEVVGQRKLLLKRQKGL